MKKKWFSALLSLALIVAMAPVAVLAGEGNAPEEVVLPDEPAVAQPEEPKDDKVVIEYQPIKMAGDTPEATVEAPPAPAPAPVAQPQPEAPAAPVAPAAPAAPSAPVNRAVQDAQEPAEAAVPETETPAAPGADSTPESTPAPEQEEEAPQDETVASVPETQEAESYPSASVETKPVPLSPAPGVLGGNWALLNLLAAVLGVALSAVMLLGHAKRRKTGAKQGVLWLGVSCVLSVAGLALFVATAWATSGVTLADSWTIAMVLLLAAQGVCLAMWRKAARTGAED